MLALLDHRAPKEIEDSLLKKGYGVLRLPSYPRLPHPVSAHADLLLFFAPEEILCTKGYFEMAKELLFEIAAKAQKPLRLIEEELGATYPQDVPLNAALVGERLFCNPKTVARRIRVSLLNEQTACVKQGYTKCSILPVGERALITEDVSIAAAARENGLEVLRIEKGHVSLPGYDTGFLGGAASCSPYQKNGEILFCGDLFSHPQAKEIQAFCHARGYTVSSLGTGALLDVGTLFLI